MLRKAPSRMPSSDVAELLRADGAAGDDRGVHDADVGGLELGGHVGLLGAGHEAVEHLEGRVHLALLRVVGDGLGGELQGLLLGRFEGGGDARLLGGGGLVVVLRRADDVLGLGADLGAGVLDLVPDLHHLGVLVEVALEELRLLALEVGELDPEVLHEAAAHDLGQLLGVGGARHLAPEGLFLQALGLPLVEGGAELLEALVEEGAALLDVDEALLALERLEAAVGVLGLLPLLVDLPAQPLPRLGGGLEAQVQALLDVEVGEGVRGGGGEVGAAGADADVDEAAVADGLDGGAAEEGADGPFHLRALPGRLGEDGVDLGLLPRPAVLRVAQEVEVLDDAPGEAAALEQLVLRLVVVVDAGSRPCSSVTPWKLRTLGFCFSMRSWAVPS